MRMKNQTKSKINPAEKILLTQMPYWDPLIPPMGIACLKAFLGKYGYNVKTVDLNVEIPFKNLYFNYFDLLKTYIPADKRGNFFNIGLEVFRNHLMSHFNYNNESEYIELVRLLIFKTFFHHLEVEQVLELNRLVDLFYRQLEAYFLPLLATERPSVLGLSVFSGTLPASLFTFKRTREKFPHIMTVMGGGVFTESLAPGTQDFNFFLKKTPYIDKIIIGEGEKLFLKLLRDELPEQQRVYTIKDINNEILNLKEAEAPDYSNADIRQYPFLGAYASRSCPFQCSFCSETVNWGTYRKKPVKKIVTELLELSEKYKTQLFLLADSLLNPVVDGLANALIKEDKAIYWDGYLRADAPVCDMNNTMRWRRGGFYRARLGVESGSRHVLDLMKKGLTVEQIKAAVSSLARAGIKTTTYWVIGHPGETEADFQQTLALITELKNNIYEAECSTFQFFMNGQVNSHEWRANSVSLYPRKAAEMLMTQTFILSGEPSREETYNRLWRFVEHCKKLGIPNPYSMVEIDEADERWNKLKRNAVPPLLEFKTESHGIDECKRVKDFDTDIIDEYKHGEEFNTDMSQQHIVVEFDF